jgi:putative ABC transport system substrate-binding protein
MRELGWVEGRNILYDRVFADDDYSRLPALAVALVARAPDVIWVVPNVATLAAYAATRSIPIVFAASSGMDEAGLVKTLAHPGGNVTGVQNLMTETAGKRLQLLKQALPKMNRVGVLVVPSSSPSVTQELPLIEKAGATLGVTVVSAIVKVPGELDGAIASLAKSRVDALMVIQTPLLMDARKRILKLAAGCRLPVVGARSQFADDGALLSYAPLLSDQVRRSAHIVDKILRGAKPADIPVEQPTNFALVVNLRTAKTLGIKIPDSIVLQATRVIE